MRTLHFKARGETATVFSPWARHLLSEANLRRFPPTLGPAVCCWRTRQEHFNFGHFAWLLNPVLLADAIEPGWPEQQGTTSARAFASSWLWIFEGF